jgi:hypothetical protein
MLARRLSVAPGEGSGGELRSLDMASVCLWDWCGMFMCVVCGGWRVSWRECCCKGAEREGRSDGECWWEGDVYVLYSKQAR